MNFLVLDVSSAPIENAAEFIGDIQAPSNYKSPDAIAKYIAEERQNRIDKAGLDIDLARITGLGTWWNDFDPSEPPATCMCRTVEHEKSWLAALGNEIRKCSPTIITFGGSSFDLPLLMRRARYLGVAFPHISTDRFKSPHRDLCEELADRNPQRKRSLQFYVKRLGWTDLTKILSGAEEAQVPQTGRWDDLEASIRHDVTATYRLAQWLGVIAREAVPV